MTKNDESLIEKLEALKQADPPLDWHPKSIAKIYGFNEAIERCIAIVRQQPTPSAMLDTAWDNFRARDQVRRDAIAQQQSSICMKCEAEILPLTCDKPTQNIIENHIKQPDGRVERVKQAILDVWLSPCNEDFTNIARAAIAAIDFA